MGFRIEDLSFGYESHPVLAGLSLELAPCRFHGVLGPNGCGKTTLLDLLSGFLKADRGRILLAGRPLSAYGPRELARAVAMVPQDYRAQFPFRTREVVRMGRHPHLGRFSHPSARDLDVAEQAMEIAGVAHLADRVVTELSGGEKQRVVFARALAQDTRVLLLDEPTASLDISHAIGILQTARKRVHERGVTVAAVMQDINLAARFCDFLVILSSRGLVAYGPTDRVLTQDNLREAFGVEALVRHEPFVDALQVVYR